MQAIEEHKDRVLQDYTENEILGVFVYGSQNYGINTPNSDVDTLAILLPSLEDLCLKDAVTRTIILSNGEECVVKDIREYAKMVKKQNINFLEILFTDYCWLNPRYNSLWEKYFVNNAELFAKIDVKKGGISMLCQAINSLNKIPLNEVSFGKKYANALRIYHSFKRLEAGENYKDAIDMSFDPELCEFLIDCKQNKKIPTREDIYNLSGLLQTMRERLDASEQKPNEEAIAALDNAVVALITNDKKNFDFYKN
jgi:predicted nucleotidyltransferase